MRTWTERAQLDAHRNPVYLRSLQETQMTSRQNPGAIELPTRSPPSSPPAWGIRNNPWPGTGSAEDLTPYNRYRARTVFFAATLDSIEVYVRRMGFTHLDRRSLLRTYILGTAQGMYNTEYCGQPIPLTCNANPCLGDFPLAQLSATCITDTPHELIAQLTSRARKPKK